MNARIATLRLSLMLVLRVWLGINVFDVNIERKGKENLASTSLFYSPFLDSLQNVKH